VASPTHRFGHVLDLFITRRALSSLLMYFQSIRLCCRTARSSSSTSTALSSPSLTHHPTSNRRGTDDHSMLRTWSPTCCARISSWTTRAMSRRLSPAMTQHYHRCWTNMHLFNPCATEPAYLHVVTSLYDNEYRSTKRTTRPTRRLNAYIVGCIPPNHYRNGETSPTANVDYVDCTGPSL
jgi:hypothetical protein